MKKYSFDFDLLGLDGNPIAHAGQFLANQLVNQPKGDVLKVFNWGVAMFKKEPLILDKSDVKTLSEMIENHETITILAKAQLIEALSRPIE